MPSISHKSEEFAELFQNQALHILIKPSNFRSHCKTHSTVEMAPVPALYTSNNSSVSIATPENDVIPFGEYIFRRLRQLSVKSIFGVPGDFNLHLLDHVKPVEDMKWVGCCNELNAAYASDGYARFSRTVGCLVTTFGVGELSAINGIGGAFAEYVPVLHIVGTSPTSKKNAPGQVHHLVPTRDPYDVVPDHQVYEKMVDGVCIGKESVSNVVDGMEQVDRLLEKIVTKARPGYLFLPLDLQNSMVDTKGRLSTSLNTTIVDEFPEITLVVADSILNKLYNSANPAIIGDILTDRFHISSLLREFVDRTEINNYSTPMGKSLLDESNESYIADYNAKLSNPGVQRAVESSDCVLHFGTYLAETNTGTYSSEFIENDLILLTPDYTKIGKKVYKEVHFGNVLKQMLAKLDKSKIPKPVRPTGINQIIWKDSKADISQSFLSQQLQKYLREGDVIVSETCSFQFAFSDIRLPKDCLFLSQSFYLSIGYAVPATLGVGLAMKDAGYSGRLILFEGDGSAQMTVQEFATYMRNGIKPTIFLLNNNGYTVERIIHGLDEEYNDIQPNWDWCGIFKTFGDKKCERHMSRQIVSKEELVETLSDSKLAAQQQIQMYEVILDKYDVPWRFSSLCESMCATK